MRLLFTAIFSRLLSSIQRFWNGYSCSGLVGFGCSTWIGEAVELSDSCEAFADIDFDGSAVFADDFEALGSFAFDGFANFSGCWRVAFEACSELLDRERIAIGCAL